MHVNNSKSSKVQGSQFFRENKTGKATRAERIVNLKKIKKKCRGQSGRG